MIDRVSARPAQAEILDASAPAPRWRARVPKDLRYLAIAAVCAVANNLLLIALVRSGINYFVGIWLAYVPMLFLAYFLHAGITFQVGASSRTFLRYALATLANYPLWIASLVVLRGALKLPIEVAAPIGTIITFIGNYLAAHWALLRSAAKLPRHAE